MAREHKETHTTRAQLDDILKVLFRDITIYIKEANRARTNLFLPIHISTQYYYSFVYKYEFCYKYIYLLCAFICS